MNYTLEELFNDDEVFHSDLQIDSFILRQNGAFHPFGIYKQALAELKARFGTLATMLRSRAQVLLPDERELPEAVRRVRELLSNRTHADLFREFARFYGVCITLKQQLCPDGQMTAELREQYTHELWEQRIKLSAVLDCRYHGMVARKTLEQALALPITLRHRVLEFVDNREEQVKFWDALVNGADLALPATRSQDYVDHLHQLLAQDVLLVSGGASADAAQATP